MIIVMFMIDILILWILYDYFRWKPLVNHNYDFSFRVSLHSETFPHKSRTILTWLNAIWGNKQTLAECCLSEQQANKLQLTQERLLQICLIVKSGRPVVKKNLGQVHKCTRIEPVWHCLGLSAIQTPPVK